MAVIAAFGSTAATLTAKTATSTVPIVFAQGGDPVQYGLVASLNRPGGNVTGVTDMANDLLPKLLGLMQELVPQAIRFGVLVNPSNLVSASIIAEVQQAASLISRPVEVITASSKGDIDVAFAGLAQKRIDALVIGTRYAFHQPRFPTCYAGHIPSSSRKLLVARISASRRVDELRSERDRP